MKEIRGFKKDPYTFLSNFYPCKIMDIDFPYIEYPSVEYAYQAAKFDNYKDRYLISKLDTPSKAKRFGKKANLSNNWDLRKVEIMKEFIYQKFNNNLELKKKLLLTDGYELIEDNWWGDTFWGICNGKGINTLGKILMEIREKLKLQLI